MVATYWHGIIEVLSTYKEETWLARFSDREAAIAVHTTGSYTITLMTIKDKEKVCQTSYGIKG